MLIGQERATEAIKFGLTVKSNNYNIYISGEEGMGREKYALLYAKEQALKEPKPEDIICVNNFKDNRKAQIIKIINGTGIKLQEDLDEFIEVLKIHLPKLYESDDYLNKKYSLVMEYENEKRNQDENYLIKLENRIEKEIKEIEYSKSLFLIGKFYDKHLKKYEQQEVLKEFIKSLKEDVLENQHLFVNQNENNKDDLDKYKINLLVDNSKAKGSPVILVENPSYKELSGDIEAESKNQFLYVKSGKLLQANNGYLILKAQQTIENEKLYNLIKKILLTKKHTIESTNELLTMQSNVILNEVEINVKVILIGSIQLFDFIYEKDIEFKKFFKIRADFETEMQATKSNKQKILNFIDQKVQENNLILENSAKLVLLEVLQKEADSKLKYSTKLNIIADILCEAKYHSDKKVTKKSLQNIITQRNKRLNQYEDKLNEMIKNNVINLQSSGSKIGEINGLVILDLQDYVFAKVIKITATTCVGKVGVINIEKEVELSGKIHDKGMLVLEGYLSNRYAQDIPLSLTTRICFEQNYNEVDGDSATVAETLALVSSLTGLPATQEIAVTGSMNQMGQVQAVGGINKKIESFYNLCKMQGFTGNQGVAIPYTNAQDLVLNDEIRKSIKNGMFTIYEIKHIEEALILILNRPMGELDEKKKYPTSSINGKIIKALKRYNKKSL